MGIQRVMGWVTGMFFSCGSNNG